ncbi:MAG: hypothetical protein JNN07_01335 [Verrucomicrobiales bacterium]|nr:hypothetical protein [Verrucomicrobiales bacterium]
MGKGVNKPRWQACNVMGLSPTGPRLWQASLAGGKVTLSREEPLEAAAATDLKLIAKDWNELVRPRLNLAVLSPSQVFVRVVHLPKAEDPAETHSMLEFQLEKLSPLPVPQIVWTYELVPSRGLSENQTVILVVVARQLVEELLGKLEGFGYLADRIELPFIDQLLALEISRDCALLFPITIEDGSQSFWVAWWYGGTLQSIGQIHLPAEGNFGEALKSQLGQMAWAGELEGWLTTLPRYYLVAEAVVGQALLARLEGHFDPPIEMVPAAPEKTLAGLTARRAIQGNVRAGLLPPEYAAKYRQLFVDKLWMQGLFGLVAAYLFAILIYFAIVAYMRFDLDSVATQERAQGIAYTNALRLRDQVRVLQDQVNLQFAALNCYAAVSTNLPAELSLDSMIFDRGAKLTVNGSGGAEAGNRVFDFVELLKKARVADQPLFGPIAGPTITVKQGGQQISWSMICDIRRPDLE